MMIGLKRAVKFFAMALAIIITILVVTGVLFVNLSPEFGASPSEAQKQQYANSPHYQDGIFVNTIPTSRDIGFVNTVKVLYKFLFNELPGLEPESKLPFEKIDSLQIVRKAPELRRLTWFGHSACLLELEGKRIFFDPMLGKTPSPHPLLGPKRFSGDLPIAIEKLPYLDAVVLSHDHYDHLDYGSIIKLKGKVGRFYVPLGVSAHLIEWGVDSAKISELDWWQEVDHDGFTFICAPARHFSGRGLTDSFATLWASWIVKTDNTTLYFSGDSGYGPHFKEIGTRYGPFDFVMLECGQYNELWRGSVR